MSVSSRLRSRRSDAPAPVSGGLRVARAGVVGACAALLAYVGHVSAGGTAVAPQALLALCGLATGVAWLCGGRQWTVAGLLALLVGAQCALHLWFAVGADASAMHAHTGHLAGSSGMTGMQSTPQMWLAHLAAALLTAVLLRRGEVWLWALLTFLARCLSVHSVGVTCALRRHRAGPWRRHGEPILTGLTASVLARRGPPALVG